MNSSSGIKRISSFTGTFSAEELGIISEILRRISDGLFGGFHLSWYFSRAVMRIREIRGLLQDDYPLQQLHQAKVYKD